MITQPTKIDFVSVALDAARALSEPKAIIGRRSTRDLRGKGKRYPPPKIVCVVDSDGKIRGITKRQAFLRLQELGRKYGFVVRDNDGNFYA